MLVHIFSSTLTSVFDKPKICGCTPPPSRRSYSTSNRLQLVRGVGISRKSCLWTSKCGKLVNLQMFKTIRQSDSYEYITKFCCCGMHKAFVFLACHIVKKFVQHLFFDKRKKTMIKISSKLSRRRTVSKRFVCNSAINWLYCTFSITLKYLQPPNVRCM